MACIGNTEGMQFCIFVAPALGKAIASWWASAVDTVRVLTLYVFSYDVLVIFSFLFALIYGCFWIGGRMDLREDERKAAHWTSLEQNWKKADEPLFKAALLVLGELITERERSAAQSINAFNSPHS